MGFVLGLTVVAFMACIFKFNFWLGMAAMIAFIGYCVAAINADL